MLYVVIVGGSVALSVMLIDPLSVHILPDERGI